MVVIVIGLTLMVVATMILAWIGRNGMSQEAYNDSLLDLGRSTQIQREIDMQKMSKSPIVVDWELPGKSDKRPL